MVRRDGGAPGPHARAAALDDSRTWFEARLWFESGLEAFLASDFDGAITAFGEAFALTGARALLYDIGEAHRRRGAHAEAAAFRRRYDDAASTDDGCGEACACASSGGEADGDGLLEPHWRWDFPPGYDAPRR